MITAKEAREYNTNTSVAVTFNFCNNQLSDFIKMYSKSNFLIISCEDMPDNIDLDLFETFVKAHGYKVEEENGVYIIEWGEEEDV